ncbi:TPA: 30S ribosomal protein S6 [Candidatus Galligastranaerophilus faecipullorum]|nr:30S ribosomal protein S6 [Candidatus Galligastranaerophilus faecipullorum]
MKKYELLATIKPNLDNDEADKVIARIEESVSSLGGSVIDTDKMGRKKLAYDVKGFRDGFIAVLKINLEADKVAEFKRQLKLNENVIRTMFTEQAAVKA